MSRILWKGRGLWVWMAFGWGMNTLIGRVWGEGTMSSFVVVLLKVVESCWEYLEKGGVSLKGVVFSKGVGSSQITDFSRSIVDAGNTNKVLGL